MIRTKLNKYKIILRLNKQTNKQTKLMFVNNLLTNLHGTGFSQVLLLRPFLDVGTNPLATPTKTGDGPVSTVTLNKVRVHRDEGQREAYGEVGLVEAAINTSLLRPRRRPVAELSLGQGDRHLNISKTSRTSDKGISEQGHTLNKKTLS